MNSLKNSSNNTGESKFIPTAGEWCWFYDHTGKTELAQFSGRTEMHSPMLCYYTTKNEYYPYVAKYDHPLPEHLTKELPSHLKDVKDNLKQINDTE
jgi:hypothetical protein